MVWDPLFDTFLKRNWAQGASNIHRRRWVEACSPPIEYTGIESLILHLGLSNALNDFVSTTWLAKRKHSDDCGAAVGKHALVVFTGTADFKCDARQWSETVFV